MSVNLDCKILVLNRLWQAVNIVGIHKGFRLLLKDNAQAIFTRDKSFRLLDGDSWLDLSQSIIFDESDSYVNTIRFKILVPKVLLLKSYSKVPVHDVKFNKKNLLERDHHKCQYCGRKLDDSLLNMDHVIPRDKGGKTSWENIVTACIKCNSKKANLLPHQANMHLIKKPERPRWRPFISSLIGQNYEDDWEHFLNLKKVAN